MALRPGRPEGFRLSIARHPFRFSKRRRSLTLRSRRAEGLGPASSRCPPALGERGCPLPLRLGGADCCGVTSSRHPSRLRDRSWSMPRGSSLCQRPRPFLSRHTLRLLGDFLCGFVCSANFCVLGPFMPGCCRAAADTGLFRSSRFCGPHFALRFRGSIGGTERSLLDAALAAQGLPVLGGLAGGLAQGTFFGCRFGAFRPDP